MKLSVSAERLINQVVALVFCLYRERLLEIDDNNARQLLGVMARNQTIEHNAAVWKAKLVTTHDEDVHQLRNEMKHEVDIFKASCQSEFKQESA